LIACRVLGSRILHGPIELLVHVVHARRQRRTELMVDAEGRFLQPHRFEVWLDRIGSERWEPEVNRTANERTRARRWTRGVADERRPVRRIERVVVLEPLVAAERSARQLQLEDVVENAPRAEGL